MNIIESFGSINRLHRLGVNICKGCEREYAGSCTKAHFCICNQQAAQHIQSIKFAAKWVLIFNYMIDEEFSIRVYQNKRHPYVFARPSCGEWEVWEMNPENDWKQNSVLCTYEYMMENY